MLSNFIVVGVVLLVGCGVLSVCGGSNDGNNVLGNIKLVFVGKVIVMWYDGVLDDLLIVGLGVSGLVLVIVLIIVNFMVFMVVELCCLVIYVNYCVLVDMVVKGGYGMFYGLNVDVSGNVM